MGFPKALLPWPPGNASGTFLDAILGRFDEVGITRVAVVTGAHHEAIAPAYLDRPVSMLFNPRHKEGQVTSVWRALEWADALEPPPEWLVLALVDTPDVSTDTLARLLGCAGASEPSCLVVRPIVGQRHGHPVLWRRDAWARLRQAPVEAGARAVVHAMVMEGRVCDVPVDDPGVLRDIDTPEDYARAAERRQPSEPER